MLEKLSDGTNYTYIYQRNSQNETVNVIAGCLDYKRQKPVAIGDYYHRDDCTICLCSTNELICNQIHCAPPTNCDGYIKKDPLHCCDVCIPPGVIERQPDEASLNMKLGALTVTLFLIVSLILFTFHRLRRKRLLVTLRRLRTLRRQDTTYSCSSSNRDAATTVLNVDLRQTSVTSADTVRSTTNGIFPIPEPPPSYASAVTLPRPVAILSSTSVGNGLPTSSSMFGEPPPPYPSSVTSINETTAPTTLRRTILTSVVSALATLRRHGRNSDSLPRVSSLQMQRDASQDTAAIAMAPTNAVATGTARSQRPRRDLLWRHSSQTSDYQDYFTDADEDEDGSGGSTSSLSASRNSLNSSNWSEDGSSSTCCCSNCDSGLSRDDDISLSSNDVRPRSEMSTIRLRPAENDVRTVVVQNNSAFASASVVDGSRSAATVDERRLCESCQNALTSAAATTSSCSNNQQQNSSAATGDNDGVEKKTKKRNVCKRKFRKLISRRKKKMTVASDQTTPAGHHQRQSTPSRRTRRRRRSAVNREVGVAIVNDSRPANNNNNNSNTDELSSSNQQNERMTTV